jgi:hypothetical protein
VSVLLVGSQERDDDLLVSVILAPGITVIGDGSWVLRVGFARCIQ